MIKWMGGTFLVILLAGLAWWQWSANQKGKIREELVLNIPDTSQIKQINILERNGERVTLVRDGNRWLVNGQEARQDAVENLLATLHDQRVSALVPTAALNNVVKDLGSNGVRFDIKGKDNESLMSFYVGGVTPDERGTFMLREGSEWPVIVNIPGFEGGLRSRYIMSMRDWKSRHIIRPVASISKLVLEYPTRQEHSFLLERSGNGYQVMPLNVPGVDPVPVHEYLVDAYTDQINHLFAEAILDDSKREALNSSIPFCQMTVTDENGAAQKVEFYPTVWIDYGSSEEKPVKIERYYTDYNDETIYLTQHLLMQKIFTGYEHFVSLKDFGKEQ